ncbi:MAG: hypothetical protein WB709_02785 [Solirubrobacteraceae bacterium]
MEFLSLTGEVTRARALEAILSQGTSEEQASELCIDAGMVRRVDVVTATATRMRIARHLREHTSGRVTLVTPQDDDVAARFIDLLLPLDDATQERVTLVGSPADPRPPAHFALVSATVVPDPEAVLTLGEFTFEMCMRARISRRRAGFVAAATMELSDNALIHATDAPDQPVLAITSFGRQRFVEIAVTDAGSALSEANDPTTLVRTIPGRAVKGEPGFLGLIMQRAREAQVDVSVEMLAGTARLRWTAKAHRTERNRHVPGTTVVVRLGA